MKTDLHLLKTALSSILEVLCFINRAQRSNKRTLYFIKTSLHGTNRALQWMKIDPGSMKPALLLKWPYILSKEPYIPSNEGSILSKELYIRRNSPTSIQKVLHLIQKSLCLIKRALHSIKLQVQIG